MGVTYREPQEAFDWLQADLFANPPYSASDMVHALADGRFIIEGKESDFGDAELFCMHIDGFSRDSKEAWEALKNHDTYNPLPW